LRSFIKKGGDVNSALINEGPHLFERKIKFFGTKSLPVLSLRIKPPPINEGATEKIPKRRFFQ